MRVGDSRMAIAEKQIRSELNIGCLTSSKPTWSIQCIRRRSYEPGGDEGGAGGQFVGVRGGVMKGGRVCWMKIMGGSRTYRKLTLNSGVGNAGRELLEMSVESFVGAGSHRDTDQRVYERTLAKYASRIPPRVRVVLVHLTSALRTHT